MESRILSNDKWIIALLFFTVFLGFFPAFSGQIAFDEDTAHYYLPAFKFYDDALRENKDFRMAPQIFSAFPLALSQVGGFLEPVNYGIFRLFPFPFAYFFRIFLDYALAALFIFLFCRTLKLGRMGSLLAALTFLTTQHTAGFLMQMANVYPFITGTFFVAAKLFTFDSFRSLRMYGYVFLGAAIFVTGMLGGYTQVNFYASVVLGFFILFMAWQRFRSEGGIKPLAVPLAGCVLFLGLGFGLFVPHLLRVSNLLPYTARSGGILWEEIEQGVGDFPRFTLGKSMQALDPRNFASAVLPKTFVIEGMYENFPFLGVMGALFFLLSWGAIRRSRDPAGEFQLPLSVWWFFLGVFLFSYLSAFPYPLTWVLHKLPLFQYFRNPGNWLIISSFAMSIMAGVGYQLYVSSAFRKRIFLLTAFLGVAAILVLIIFDSGPALRVFNPPGAVDVILVLVLWGAAVTWSAFRLGTNFLVGVLIAGFVLPLWIHSYKDTSSFSLEAMSGAPWVYEEIQRRESGNEPFRTYVFYPGDFQWSFFISLQNPAVAEMIEFQREYAQPQLFPLLHDIESIRGFDNFIPKRYKRVLEFVSHEPSAEVVHPPIAPRVEDMLLAVPPSRFDILGMMNVKYVWTIVELASPVPVQGVVTERIASSRLTPSDLPIHLYRNARFIPRVFSPSEIVVLENDEEENFTRVIEGEHNFRKVGFIECDKCALGPRAQMPVSIEPGEVTNTSLTFRVLAVEDAWVIISNSFIPGWRALIDGNETDIYYANYIYQGLRVPRGEHNVVLEYR